LLLLSDEAVSLLFGFVEDGLSGLRVDVVVFQHLLSIFIDEVEDVVLHLGDVFSSQRFLVRIRLPEVIIKIELLINLPKNRLKLLSYSAYLLVMRGVRSFQEVKMSPIFKEVDALRAVPWTREK